MNELLYQLLARFGGEDSSFSPLRQIGGDGFVPDDEPYLRQFLGASKDGGLIPTNARPSHLRVSDSHPWYQPTVNPLTISVKHPGAAPSEKYKPLNATLIDALLPGNTIPIPTENAPGLGGYTASVGKHADGRPYASVYDKWDFNSPIINPVVGKILDKLGKPYHIYGRYPLIKQEGDNAYKIFSGNEDIPLPDEPGR